MSKYIESRINFLQYLRGVFIMGLIIAAINARPNQANSSIVSTPKPTTESGALPDWTSGPSLTSATAKPPSQNGVQYPYADQLFYPAATPPAHAQLDSEWDCFEVPPGGTVFAAITVAGNDPATRFDTQETRVFYTVYTDTKGDVLVIPDTSLPPNQWGVKTDQVGSKTIVCSR